MSAIDQAAWPIVVADVLGRVTFANRAAAQLIGLAPDRIYGRHFSTFLSHGPIPQLDQITARVAAGRSWSGPIVTSRQDAAGLDIELTVSPVRDAEGTVGGSVALLRDLRAEHDIADLLGREVRQQASVGAAAGRPRFRLSPSVCWVGKWRGRCSRLTASTLPASSRSDPVTRYRCWPIAPGGRRCRGSFVSRPRARAICGLVPPGAPGSKSWSPSVSTGTYGHELKAAGIRAIGYAPSDMPVGRSAFSPSGTRDARAYMSWKATSR